MVILCELTSLAPDQQQEQASGAQQHHRSRFGNLAEGLKELAEVGYAGAFRKPAICDHVLYDPYFGQLDRSGDVEAPEGETEDA